MFNTYVPLLVNKFPCSRPTYNRRHNLGILLVCITQQFGLELRVWTKSVFWYNVLGIAKHFVLVWSLKHPLDLLLYIQMWFFGYSFQGRESTKEFVVYLVDSSPRMFYPASNAVSFLFLNYLLFVQSSIELIIASWYI